jgi:putative DNA primase/helicase
MTATTNEETAGGGGEADQKTIHDLLENSSKKQPFSEDISTENLGKTIPLNPEPNHIAFKAKKGSAAETEITTVPSTKETLDSIGARWRGGSFNKSTKSWVNPDRLYRSIELERQNKLLKALKDLGIDQNEIDFSPVYLPPPPPRHIKTAGKIAKEVSVHRSDAESLRKEMIKKIHDLEISHGQDIITDEFLNQQIEEIQEHYQTKIDELTLLAIKKEGSEFKILTERNSKKDLNFDLDPFTIEEIQQAVLDEHVGDASLFKKLSKGDFLFDPHENSFYQWNGILWVKDEGRHRNKLLIRVAEKFAMAADLAKREAIRLAESSPESAGAFSKIEKTLSKRASSLKTVQRQSSVLDMAKVDYYGKDGIDGLTFSGTWDSSIGCIPCANGLLDIRTGKLRAPKREHFIRKASGVNYAPNASGQEFHSFVTQIMNGMEERANFLRRFFGYATFGRPIEDKLLFLWGEHGRNGKGTIVRCICSVLGDIAKTFSPELILLQRNPPSSSTPRPDLVHLQGVRVAIFSEINKGRQIDAATLKNLTGRDIIAARSLHSNDIKNFSPSHTLILQANHKPKSPSEDEALWRRFILVPFDLTFIDDPDPNKPHERKVDRGLEERLLQNPSGILRWLLDGAEDYLKQGLAIPKEIAEATQAYRAENDGIGSFIREHCVLGTNLSVKRSEITRSIQDYCITNKFDRPTRNDICEYLRGRGFKEERDVTGGLWRGISISRES